MEAFLRTLGPLRLADADGGTKYLSHDDVVLQRGKIVFAENCARCHSSKRPSEGSRESQVNWFREAVLRDDFLENNFLSDDERYPVSEIGTNAERALATNARRGQLWEEFSSETYKSSRPVRVSGLENPLLPGLRLPPAKVSGGLGYYRTPSLVNVWATAPFLHNNSVGLYSSDPSVAGRVRAYENAMELLLWPERRLGRKSIHRTTATSYFQFEGGARLCIAANTPIDLVANADVKPRQRSGKRGVLDDLRCAITESGAVNSLFLFLDNAPDFVEDRGHTFGSGLTDADKRALIEYVKTF